MCQVCLALERHKGYKMYLSFLLGLRHECIICLSGRHTSLPWHMLLSMRFSYGVGVGVGGGGIPQNHKGQATSLENTLEFGLSLLEINGFRSGLRKRKDKVLHHC